MTLGQKIKHLAKSKRINQHRLASQLNMSKSTLTRWVGDQICPTLHETIKLAEILDVSLDYLAYEEGICLPAVSLAGNDVPTEIRMIVSVIGRDEALDRLLLRRRDAIAGQSI